MRKPSGLSLLKAVSSRASLVSSLSSDSLAGDLASTGGPQQSANNRRPRRQRTFSDSVSPERTTKLDGGAKGAAGGATLGTSPSFWWGPTWVLLRTALLMSAFGLAALLLSASVIVLFPAILPSWIALEVLFASWLWLSHIPRLARIPEVHAPTEPYCPSRSFDNFIRQASLQVPAEALSGDPSEDEVDVGEQMEEEEEGEEAKVLRWAQGGDASSSSPSLSPSRGEAQRVEQQRRVVNSRFLLSSWFHGIDCSQLRLGNVAELLAYGFHFKSPSELSASGQAHVPTEMARRFISAAGLKLAPGYRSGLRSPLVTTMRDPLKCGHRPLVFYLAMEVVSLFCRAYMVFVLGFRLEEVASCASSSSSSALGLPPLRVYTLNHHHHQHLPNGSSSGFDAGCKAPSRRPSIIAEGVDVWHQGPEGRGSLDGSSPLVVSHPILFMHGIGMGLLSYLPAIAKLAAASRQTGQAVVCLEIRHVSMRLCGFVPTIKEVAQEVVTALDVLGIDKVATLAHSYSTCVASYLIQHHPERIQSTCLIDPVCFGVFLPPRPLYGWVRLTQGLRALLMDMFVLLVIREPHQACTWYRRFYWPDATVFIDGLPDRTTFVLSGQDHMIHSVEEVRTVLEGHTHCQVLHNPNHAHAGFLFDSAWQDRIIEGVLEASRE